MENLNSKDRTIRTLIGMSFILAMLMETADPLYIAALTLASFYPLLTALLSWDPVYSAVTEIASVFTKTKEVSAKVPEEKLSI